MTVTYTGTEGGPNIPPPSGAISFDYDKATINAILNAGRGSDHAGIRFHFNTERPNPPTDLFAIGVTGGAGTQEMFTPTGADYKASVGNHLTRAQFQQIISPPNNAGEKTGTCVYISRMILEGLLADRNGQPRSGIRLFVVGFQNTFSTLTAVSLDSTQIMDGPFVRSEMPCPPNCGTDY